MRRMSSAAFAAALLWCSPADASIVYQTSFVFDEPWFDMSFEGPQLGPGEYDMLATVTGDYLDFFGWVEKRTHYEYYCDSQWCGGDEGGGVAGTFGRSGPNMFATRIRLNAAYIENPGPWQIVHSDDEIGRITLGVEPGQSRAPVRWTLTVTSVPEPSTWATMVAGFGLAGAATRRSRLPRSSDDSDAAAWAAG